MQAVNIYWVHLLHLSNILGYRNVPCSLECYCMCLDVLGLESRWQKGSMVLKDDPQLSASCSQQAGQLHCGECGCGPVGPCSWRSWTPLVSWLHTRQQLGVGQKAGSYHSYPLSTQEARSYTHHTSGDLFFPSVPYPSPSWNVFQGTELSSFVSSCFFGRGVFWSPSHFFWGIFCILFVVTMKDRYVLKL